MKHNPATRGTLVLVVTASALLIVFASLSMQSNTKSANKAAAKPYTIEAYEETLGLDGLEGVLRARFRVRRNEAGHVIANGLQRWLRSDGTVFRQQEIWDARFVNGEFEPPGVFGKPKYFWRPILGVPSPPYDDSSLQFSWLLKDGGIEEYETDLSIVIAGGVVLHSVKSAWKFKEVKDR